MSYPQVKPMGNKILVLPDEDKDEMRNGIIISSIIKSQLQEGTVVKIAIDVEPLLSPGDRILFPRGAGVTREYNGIYYLFLNGPTAKEQGDVWAII